MGLATLDHATRIAHAASLAQTLDELHAIAILVKRPLADRQGLAFQLAKGKRPGFAPHVLWCANQRGQAPRRDCSSHWGDAKDQHRCVDVFHHVGAHWCACGGRLP